MLGIYAIIHHNNKTIDARKALTVGVEHLGGELDDGRFIRILLCEIND